jgi:hypothetical protein
MVEIGIFEIIVLGAPLGIIGTLFVVLYFSRKQLRFSRERFYREISGSDVIYGGKGYDTVMGGEGSDQLFGQ